MPKFVVQENYRYVGEYEIPEGRTLIGRSDGNDLSLNSGGVSRHHAQVSRMGKTVMVADLESRNGTFVNSSPISQDVQLKHGDVLQLGETMLVYNESEAEVETTIGESAEERVFNLVYLQRIVNLIKANIGRVVQGKDDVIGKVLIALLSDGHVLIEDVPGVGKTMLAQALAKSVCSDFKRIQFTPDLLPTDITGVNIYDEKSKKFSFMPGPIFANVILADEINRGTPRTQSSLLECMSEAMVTVDGGAHVLQKPFFVIATQNPVHFHGTYPLPEAQLDRFMIRLRMGYPSREVERDILSNQVASHPINSISYVVHSSDLQQCQALVRTVHVSDLVKDYIVTIADATRLHSALVYGCSPRASLALMHAGQSLAAMQGRDYVMPRDCRDLAISVLSHRLPLRLQARAEWESPEAVLQGILDQYPVEKWEKS